MRNAVVSRIALFAFLIVLLVPAVALSRNVYAAWAAGPTAAVAAPYPHAMTAEEGQGCPYLRGEAGPEGRGCPYLERRHAAPAPEPGENEGGTGCPYLDGGGEAARAALRNRV